MRRCCVKSGSGAGGDGKSLDVGPVHAVWSGLGAVGALVGGVQIFGVRLRTATMLVTDPGLVLYRLVAALYATAPERSRSGRDDSWN